MKAFIIEATDESFARAKKVLEEGVAAVENGLNGDYFESGLLYEILKSLGAFERGQIEVDCEAEPLKVEPPRFDLIGQRTKGV